MKEGQNDMGMINKQFNGFIRFILRALTGIHNSMPEISAKDELANVIDILQDTLEDN